MKKHPIDELFETRLTGHTQTPSNGAWEKIQSRRNEKRKRFAPWMWYAAAGLSLTLASIYVLWQTEIRMTNDGGRADVAAVDQSTPKNDIKVIPLQDHDSEILLDKASQPPLLKEKEEPEKGTARNETGENLEEYDAAGNNELVREVPQLKISDEAPGILAERLSEVKIKQAETEAQNHASLTPAEIEIPKRENRVVLVTVQEPVPDSSEMSKTKTSRFSRVLRQLKNAREGERVDWNEMGINTKSILARAENNDENNTPGNRKTKR